MIGGPNRKLLGDSVIGRWMYLREQEQGSHKTEAVQQRDSENERTILALMQEGGYTLKQIIEQRIKILGLETSINDAAKAQNDLLAVQATELRRVGDEQLRNLELRVSIQKASADQQQKLLELTIEDEESDRGPGSGG